MIHNCKVKDSTLNITVYTAPPTRINKIGRALVKFKQPFKQALNIPDRVMIVRLPTHISGAKRLESNTTTEIQTYKGRQVIKVRNTINNRFLRKI